MTVGLFGTFGFKENGLYDAYKKVCPNITIKEDVVEQSADYWTRLKTRLASGSGLDDVQAIEIGFVADVVQNHADQFVNWNRRAQRGRADKAEFYPLEVAAGRRPTARPRSGSAPTSARRRSATAATCSSRPVFRPTRRRLWPRSGRPGTTSSPSASSTRRPRPSRPARTSSTARRASSPPPSTRARAPTPTTTASRTSRTATACKTAWKLRHQAAAGGHHRRAAAVLARRGTRPSPAARSRRSPAPPG